VTGGADPHPAPEQVAHALRRMRAQCYRIDASDAGTSVALIMQASVAGRRNAAVRLVELLRAEGLSVVGDDPVEQLTASPVPLPITRG
jgi:hypothetical protein